MPVDLDKPQAEFPGRYASLPLQTQIRLSRRSWWEVLFVGGQTLAEWQTAGGRIALPVAWLSPRSKWEDVDHSRVVAVRLWCPDGRVAEVRATGPNRVIQFKVGMMSLMGRVTQAHVIGVLTDDEGGCDCWEWEPETKSLRRFQDNILRLHQRYTVGPFSPEALDLDLKLHDGGT